MKDFLDKASEAYYSGSPIISDDEFDRLAEIYNYNTVGHSVTDGIPHVYRMYSLQKYYEGDELPNLKDYVSTPKLDGAAVSLLYINGSLELALTRGDGNIGRDITEKMRMLVPNTLSSATSTLQITGEVVCPVSVENSRNVAAGSLNLKDMDEFRSRPLSFVAYGLQGLVFDTWSEAMSRLHLEGFNTVDTFDATNFPTDGIVYRVDNNARFEREGYTSNHPRGAFALKQRTTGVITTLNDVVWQVGKSGVVSPVAILEPVKVGDATVSRATLHNIDYIDELGLEIGCNVEIIRSGEIIPRVVQRV